MGRLRCSNDASKTEKWAKKIRKYIQLSYELREECTGFTV